MADLESRMYNPNLYESNSPRNYTMGQRAISVVAASAMYGLTLLGFAGAGCNGCDPQIDDDDDTTQTDDDDTTGDDDTTQPDDDDTTDDDDDTTPPVDEEAPTLEVTIDASEIFEGQQVTFTYNAQDNISACDDIDIGIDFGDDSSPYSGTCEGLTSHLYEQPGTYAVLATALDEAGNLKEKNLEIEVKPLNIPTELPGNPEELNVDEETSDSTQLLYDANGDNFECAMTSGPTFVSVDTDCVLYVDSSTNDQDIGTYQVELDIENTVSGEYITDSIDVNINEVDEQHSLSGDTELEVDVEQTETASVQISDEDIGDNYTAECDYPLSGCSATMNGNSVDVEIEAFGMNWYIYPDGYAEFQADIDVESDDGYSETHTIDVTIRPAATVHVNVRNAYGGASANPEYLEGIEVTLATTCSTGATSTTDADGNVSFYSNCTSPQGSTTLSARDETVDGLGPNNDCTVLNGNTLEECMGDFSNYSNPDDIAIVSGDNWLDIWLIEETDSAACIADHPYADTYLFLFEAQTGSDISQQLGELWGAFNNPSVFPLLAYVPTFTNMHGIDYGAFTLDALAELNSDLTSDIEFIVQTGDIGLADIIYDFSQGESEYDCERDGNGAVIPPCTAYIRNSWDIESAVEHAIRHETSHLLGLWAENGYDPCSAIGDSYIFGLHDLKSAYIANFLPDRNMSHYIEN